MNKLMGKPPLDLTAYPQPWQWWVREIWAIGWRVLLVNALIMAQIWLLTRAIA